MNTSTSFSEYITKTFSDNFYYNQTSKFIRSHINEFDFQTRIIQSPTFNDIENISLLRIDVLKNDGETVNFDMIVIANVSIKEFHSHSDDYDCVNLWLTINCDFSFNKPGNPVVNDIRIFDRSNKNSRSNDDSLVPFISKNDFETYAEKFLAKYYPSALKTATPINVDILTRNIGLTVKFNQISDDGSILGRIYFVKTDEFEAGTILVDPEVFFMGRIGSLSFTIIHECVHWEFHRNAIKLLQLTSGNNLNSITCNSNLTNKDNMFYWLEYQANKLTPCILMPKVTFISKAKEVINRLHKYYGTHNDYEVIVEAIEELSKFYNVSPMAIKLRLISVGFSCARGALEYVDDHYVQSYLVPKNTKSNYSYTIPFTELLIAQYFDNEIRIILESGKFLFVDNHLCLSDSKYITETNKLTEYAKTHMDECCVCFELNIKGAIDLNYASEIYLNRDKKATYTPTYTYIRNETLSLNQQFKYTVTDISDVLNSAPGSFSKTFKLYSKWVGDPSILDLSIEADVGTATISRIRDGKTSCPDKLTLFKLCIAMKLPYPLSEDLFKKAGYNLSNSPEDIAIKTILQTCVNDGVEICVKRLNSVLI